jgi:hypothetical protein
VKRVDSPSCHEAATPRINVVNGTHTYPTTARPGVVALGVRTGTWRRDYTICRCQRYHQDCPHCGEARSDRTHRGRCHARMT